MEGVAKILGAVVALFWPLLMFFVIVRFGPAVREIIQSAKSRRFTLKVGGQELTMDEVSEQQRVLIDDLHTQVNSLRTAIESITGSSATVEAAVQSETVAAIRPSVLWVDDQPKNNSYFVQQLADLGVRVDLSLTTAEGVRQYERGKYSIVVSDMGRAEGGSYNPKAGIDLLQEIRRRSRDMPFIIFCSRRKVFEYGDQARQLGATAITASPTELSGLLQHALLKGLP